MRNRTWKAAAGVLLLAVVRGNTAPPSAKPGVPNTYLYFSQQWPNHAQIYSMNADGSGVKCLTPDTDSDYHVAVSPDGRTLLFTTHRDGVRSLYLMNADGTDQRRLTTEADAGLGAWSPDGKQIAFSSNRDGRYCIYVMKADGTHTRRLSNGPSDDCPAWSPDGRTIAYQGMSAQTWRKTTLMIEITSAKQSLIRRRQR